MIANVTMAFNFVGGSGLKSAVDKLQNALTFNYYANAEIWDDRADVTAQEKFLEVLDNEFLAMDTPPAPPTANQASPNSGQDNNSTIGTTLTNVVTASGETGTISYGNFMAKFVTETQTYFTNVVNKTKETVNQYNNAVRQQWMLERSYTQGNLSVDTPKVVIFGKPNNVEKRFDQIFGDLSLNISQGEEKFIQFISTPQKNFSPRLIQTVKDNYQNLVKNKRSSFQNAITKITQDLTTVEQSYIQTMARVNIITFTPTIGTPYSTDGYQAKSGPVRVYVLSPTSKVSTGSNGAANTLIELVNDVKKVQADIGLFNAAITTNTKFVYPGNSKEYEGVLVFETVDGISKAITVNEVFKPFSTNANFESNVFRRTYMIVSDDVLDDKKYQTFKTAMIGNIINNKSIIGNGFDDIEKVFDDYWITIAKPIFLEENNITKSFIENVEKTKLKNFLVYTPFDTKKTREFNYTTENGAVAAIKKSQENMIKGLGATTNQNTNNNTWNDTDGNSTGAYISKAKLN